MQSSPIDLHIELSSIRNFVNDQIEQGNPLSFNGKEFYEILKRVIINLESKPFLSLPKDESERNYYDKYRRQSQEEFGKLIADFFEYEDEFYDLDRVQYAQKEFIGAGDFEKLFIIKLLELKSNECSIGEFLSFQQFDNFYGQKDSIDSFLYQLTENDSNCRLLKDLCQILRDWIDNQNLEILMLSPKKSYNLEVEESVIENVDSQEKWNHEIESLKGTTINCKWDLDQIRHFFSFLYKEKSENGEPYLKKEQVDQILKNGLQIPDKPIEPLFKPNCSKRYPFKNITFAINFFYSKSSKKFNDKRAYYLFFSMFIEGYSHNLISQKSYENFSRNTSKSLPGRTTLNLIQYLPPDFIVPKKGL